MESVAIRDVNKLRDEERKSRILRMDHKLMKWQNVEEGNTGGNIKAMQD